MLRIANTCAFWGDSIGASARTISQDPHIDFLTLDYLAEVSMSILAKLKQRDPSAGYANDFLEVIRSLIPAWKSGGKFKIVTNAGGLNPRGCAQACRMILSDAGLNHLKIVIVTGDDVLPTIKYATDTNPQTAMYAHLETGEKIGSAIDKIVTANAYVGAKPIADAIRRSADIVITGRVADPSLTVGPCIAHFGWKDDDFDRLAGATVAGHLIECGTQVTGGICTDWLKLRNNIDIGFPIVEIDMDGSCVVTKPTGTGGAVNEQTVKEQLLYELGDPANYLSPDVTASFLTLSVEDQGNDRVRVSGATGRAPPRTLKVSATLRAGYRASGTLTIFGAEAALKAIRSAVVLREHLKSVGKEPREFHFEPLGSGLGLDGRGFVLPPTAQTTEAVIRMTAADDRKDVVESFSRELVSLVTAGPQGTTGYFDGRPAVREVFSYWPCLIDRGLVKPVVEMVSA